MNTETPLTYQCRHIHTAGQRCGSPALRNEDFCYFHHTTRKPAFHRHADRQAIQLYDQRQKSLSSFELPLPDDQAAIQLSIGQILQRLAANTIEPKRAGLILYALQIASLNLPKPARNAEPVPTVEEIEHHPELGVIAPTSEIQKAPRERPLDEIFIEYWEQDKQDARDKQEAADRTAQNHAQTDNQHQASAQAQAKATSPAPTPCAQTISTIQAVADPEPISKSNAELEPESMTVVARAPETSSFPSAPEARQHNNLGRRTTNTLAQAKPSGPNARRHNSLGRRPRSRTTTNPSAEGATYSPVQGNRGNAPTATRRHTTKTRTPILHGCPSKRKKAYPEG